MNHWLPGSSILLACLLFGVLCVAGPDVAYAQQEPTITCAPERPAVVPREVIHALAWTSSDASRYEWTVSGGRVVGQGADVTWDFAGVEPGTYTATVKSVGLESPAATCSMQVIVMDPGDSRGVPRLSGRSLLEKDEAPGS